MVISAGVAVEVKAIGADEVKELKDKDLRWVLHIHSKVALSGW